MKALASAIASSMASLVPDPMEKCAVCAASPISTVFPWCQLVLRTKGKLSQIDRLESSRWPARSSAKSRSQNARLSASDILSRRARRQHYSGNTTVNLVAYETDGVVGDFTWVS